jgi:hypothetical protein
VKRKLSLETRSHEAAFRALNVTTGKRGYNRTLRDYQKARVLFLAAWRHGCLGHLRVLIERTRQVQ